MGTKPTKDDKKIDDELIHPSDSAEISDSELDDVAGGIQMDTIYGGMSFNTVTGFQNPRNKVGNFTTIVGKTGFDKLKR